MANVVVKTLLRLQLTSQTSRSWQFSAAISSQNRNFSNFGRQQQFDLLRCASKSNPINVYQRYLSIFRVNDRIQLYTEKPRQIKKDDQTLRLEQETNGRPLLIICAYLLAKEKHLAKYAEFYFQHGFDVLVTSNTPWQILWPTKTQDVSKDILKFLENNDYYDRMVLHGFSVGGYVWAECMVHMNKNPAKYEKLLGRIKGQIWDSIIYLVEVPIGFSKAVIPNNQFFQQKLRNYIEFHLRMFEEETTRHLRFAHQTFRENLVKSPALMLVSEVDPIGTVSSNLSIYNSWKAAGMNVTWKCFESSPHVCHFLKYKNEYVDLLNNHLKLINLHKENSA